MSGLSRHEFLERMAQAGAALLLSSLDTLGQTQRKPTRVGVIGCGSVSGQYLPHLSKSPRVELHVLEIIEAARESGRTGRRVALTSTFTLPMP